MSQPYGPLQPVMGMDLRSLYSRALASYSSLLVWRDCKAMYVPAVTVQSGKDLQLCAELHFS
jgi:hypothetical protein